MSKLPAPKILNEFKVEIVLADNKQTYDITPAIIEMSIFESIYSINLHGEMRIMDSYALLSSFPILGQEKIIVKFDRLGTKVKETFYITKVEDVKKRDGIGGYVLKFTSQNKVLNGISEFSRSYSGNGVDIIRDIYEDTFGSIDVEAKGASAFNMVIPFMKPFQAINMIQQATSDVNHSPLFIFERLYKKPVITSLEVMAKKNPTEAPSIDLNTPTTDGSDNASSLRQTVDQIGKLYDFEINKAHDVFEQAGQGAFANRYVDIDISTKTVKSGTYKKEWTDYSNITPYTVVDNKALYDNAKTKTIKNIDASLAYQTLSSVHDNPLEMSKKTSFLASAENTIGAIHLDSIPGLSAGDTIDLTFMKLKPTVDKKENVVDQVNSGKYIIASLRHMFVGGEYTMSGKVIRSDIGLKWKGA